MTLYGSLFLATCLRFGVRWLLSDLLSSERMHFVESVVTKGSYVCCGIFALRSLVRQKANKNNDDEMLRAIYANTVLRPYPTEMYYYSSPKSHHHTVRSRIPNH